MPEHRPVISSATRIGICTLTSRLTGLIRDMLLVHTFGAGWVLDSFFYGFQVPNLFRRLFGEGALAAVFVPAFTHTLETEGRPSAWRLLARTLALLTVAIVLVVLVIEAIVLVIWLMNPGDEARRLILGLTALMLPFMLTICLIALLSSILNCVGSFVPAAIAPIILNLVMIAALAWFRPTIDPGRGIDDRATQVFGVAASVLVAGVLQILFLLPVLRRYGVGLGWRFDLRDPRLKKMLAAAGPVVLGQGVLALGVFIDAQICTLLTHVQGDLETRSLFGLSFTYPLQEGALSAITVAQRLYQFPLGVFGISLAVAALPTFSRLATRKDWAGWTGEVGRSLRLAVFAGLLAGCMMILLAEPIVRLLFEYGEFGPGATTRAARVLACYGFGMWAFCAHHIVLRGFYSVGDVRTPLRISCFLVPANVALSLVLVWSDVVREAAFGIATSTTSALAVIVGTVLLQRRTLARLVDRPLLTAMGKMVLAALLAVIVVAALRPLWTAEPGPMALPLIVHRAIDALGSLALGSAVYLASAWALRLSEVRLLLKHRRTVGNRGD
jgi:putative peptidoglycan lipid II flippase